MRKTLPTEISDHGYRQIRSGQIRRADRNAKEIKKKPLRLVPSETQINAKLLLHSGSVQCSQSFSHPSRSKNPRLQRTSAMVYSQQ